jgi:type VI secretion system protein ImpC
VIIGDYTWNGSAEHARAMAGMAGIATACGGPFVAAAADSLVGFSPAEPRADPRSWQPATGESWSALCSNAAASHLGLAWPRFLLRLPYGTRSRPIERFQFEEITGKLGSARLLWGNPAFLVALLLGRGYSQSGWGCPPGSLAEVDELPIWVYQDEDGDDVVRPCGEVLLTEAAAARVAEAGFMPVLSYRERDQVRVGVFQSIRKSALSGRWGR